MLRSIIVHFRLVLQLLCRLTLFITAGAFIDNLARRFTGRSVFNVLEAVRLVHFLVAAAADLFVIDVVALYRLRFPTVCCRVSEGLSAFFAELVAGASVLRLPELNLIVRMVALFYLTTACAEYVTLVPSAFVMSCHLWFTVSAPLSALTQKEDVPSPMSMP